MTPPVFEPVKRTKIQFSQSENPWLGSAFTVIFIGGLIFSIVAFFVFDKFLAFGIASGTLLSILNFHLLNKTSKKILRNKDESQKGFWIWSIVRWVLAVLVCWGLALISISCLLGAFGGYLWALSILGWKAWRAASDSMASKQPTK